MTRACGIGIAGSIPCFLLDAVPDTHEDIEPNQMSDESRRVLSAPAHGSREEVDRWVEGSIDNLQTGASLLAWAQVFRFKPS